LKTISTIILVIFSILYFISSTLSAKDDFPVLQGPYLGQKPPGMTPEIFAPGIVSTGYNERIAAFTPDGKEFYFILYGAPHMVILYMKEEKGRWTRPRVSPFSGKYDAEFNISPDGNTIVYASEQPENSQGKPGKGHIWLVERGDKDWREPKIINPSFYGYPSLSKNGHLYFNPRLEDGFGGEDIWVSKYVNGEYTEPENLGSSVNSQIDEVDPFIAPDESYIIFLRRDENGYGRFDLFISYQKDNGSWTNAKNMGEPINSTASEICPSISPDGKYFFFTSYRTTHKNYSEIPLTYEEKIRILNSPGNGLGDIYWVDAKVIENLKPKNL
jgi:Tol biopolymer transport system component